MLILKTQDNTEELFLLVVVTSRNEVEKIHGFRIGLDSSVRSMAMNDIFKQKLAIWF
jgi:hypothetical protein